MKGPDFWGRSIDRLKDFDKLPNTKFIIVCDKTESHMGADYGPPDPPPKMETSTYLTMVGLDTEEQVTDWILDKAKKTSSTGGPFKIFKITPVTIKTEVKITLE
jgi:hypothetical protein